VQHVAEVVLPQHLLHHLAPVDVVVAVPPEAHLDHVTAPKVAHAQALLVDHELVVAEAGRVGRPAVVGVLGLGPHEVPRRDGRVVARLLQEDLGAVGEVRLQRLAQRGVEGLDKLVCGVEAGDEARRDELEPLHGVRRRRRPPQEVRAEAELICSTFQDGARLAAANWECNRQKILSSEDTLPNLFHNFRNDTATNTNALEVNILYSSVRMGECVATRADFRG